MKKYILSWGGGVNSTAMLAMLKLGMLPELNKDNLWIIFADTGAEMPYTYEHTSRCIGLSREYRWMCMRPYDERWRKFYSPRCKDKTLIEFCFERNWIPSRMNRWCSSEYKIIPITKFRKSLGETTIILGIANDEQHRAKELGKETVMYPLIDQSIDRQGCIDLAKKADLPITQKSGCYFCPFQRKAGWIDLYHNYKDLFDEAVKLEDNAHLKWSDSFSLTPLPLKQQMEKWMKMAKKKCDQQELFDEHRHCLCEL